MGKLDSHTDAFGAGGGSKQWLFSRQSLILNFTVSNKEATPMTLNVYVSRGGVEYLISPKDAQIAAGELGGDKNVVVKSNDFLKIVSDKECDICISFQETDDSF